MHRRVRTSLALVVATLACVAACSGSSAEQKLLSDFFRAARLRDSATLANFATASFEPRSDGVVESFTITGVNDALDDGDIGYTIVTAAASRLPVRPSDNRCVPISEAKRMLTSRGGAT